LASVDVRRFHVFLTIVEELHLDRAADRHLFEGTNRRVALTAMGEAFKAKIEPA